MPFITKKVVITLGCVASIFLVISLNSLLMANHHKSPPAKVEPLYPTVAVTKAKPIAHSAKVTAYGEVQSRHQLALTSQVYGQITYLSDKFLTGKTFKSGELIARIEPIVYQQALADAKSTLADAKLSLAQEEVNSAQAKAEWQRSGKYGQHNELALQAAQAKYQMALQAVSKAEYDLAQTNIVAPFDALVVTRSAQLGSYIQVGGEVATLYDISLFEVALPLTSQEWQLIAPQSVQSPAQFADLQSTKITLVDETKGNRWQANLDRFEQHINQESRQRALIASVSNPINRQTPLYPGTFVKAQIEGQPIEQLWQIPASALIDNNTVWQVNEQGLLKRLPIELLFSDGNLVYIKPVVAQAEALIVNRPLASYLADMKVSPVAETQQEVSL